VVAFLRRWRLHQRRRHLEYMRRQDRVEMYEAITCYCARVPATGLPRRGGPVCAVAADFAAAAAAICNK
jgi:hypothetical protein